MQKFQKSKRFKKENVNKLLKSSSVLNIKKFQKKAQALHDYCLNHHFFETIEETVTNFPCPFAVFFSISNMDSSAAVLIGTGKNIESAWKDAIYKTEQFLQKNIMEVCCLKVDFVDQAQWFPLKTINEILQKTRQSYWQCGISFDCNFCNAFLEEEQNIHRLIQYNSTGISLANINEYLLFQKRPPLPCLPDKLLVFSCQAVFSDQNHQIYSLYDEGFSYGRRKISCIDKKLLNEVLETSQKYLSTMIQPNGKFIYGYFADLNLKITSYNILRHLGTIWAILMQYAENPDEYLKHKIDSALQYVLDTSIVINNNAAYIVEHATNEIKLGGNAVAVITLITYMEVMKCDTHVPLIKQLGEGILTCQNDDGSYWHILSPSTFQRVLKYRTVYYDGEAAFALSKLFGVTKEEKWLQAAKKSMQYFIQKNYSRYADHWIAYALNELTKYTPDEQLFSFAIKNVQSNLEKIYKQDTSYHTYLELLLASFETLQRAKKLLPTLSTLQTFNEKQLIITIYYRAQHMLLGYLYPECAMYLKKPNKFVGAFCVRHDHYRVRIDDIQHYIGGYFHMLKNFDILEKQRLHFNITPEDYMTPHLFF